MKINAFLTDLEKYNNGALVGEWVEFPTDETESEILERLGIKGEYFFTDYEGYDFGEFISIEQLNDYAQTLEDVSEELLESLLEVATLSETMKRIQQESYIFYDGWTLEEVAVDLMNDLYEIPEYLENYIDYEAFARDLSLEGYTETAHGVIFLE